MKKMFLVDVSSLFFRAFYAIRPLTSPSGVPTNAIYGFLTMTTKLIREQKPDYVAFCYDRKEPSFRKEVYDDYKANRSEMPEDLVPQIPYIKKVADYLGVTSVEVPSFEADDIIGTLTKFGRKQGCEVYIVSGDKDFAQLIEPHVFLYDTMKDTKTDVAGVKEKWGIRPDQMIDYLALIGDASDNIPGVMGIGPKGAQKLLEEFDTLDNIYANIDSIKGSVKEKLIKDKKNAYLSKQLVTIVTDVNAPNKLSDYELSEINWDKFKALLEELNFKTLEKTIQSLPNFLKDKASSPTTVEKIEPSAEAPSEAKVKSTWVFEEIDVKAFCKSVESGEVLWGINLPQGLYLASESKRKIFRIQGEAHKIGKDLKSKKIKWKGHDLKSFFHLISAENPVVVWDSMLAAYVVRPGGDVEFATLVQTWVGRTFPEFCSPEELMEISTELEKALNVDLQKLELVKITETFEFPLVPILFKMEKLGIKLDSELLAKQSKELGAEIHELEKKIHMLAKENFNIASPKQLSHVLFDKLQLPVMKKTKTGYSTDNEVLEKLKNQHDIIAPLLDYRELTKLKSTYVDSLPQLVKEDGRIHSTFNQALTATGRLSSIDPNLQNIPIRTEKGARVRKAFIAEKGKQLMSVDYSQIELRVLAHYSSDKNLCKAFFDDLDVHSITASEVFSVKLKDVTSEMRRTAKAVNFGIAYGQGAYGLAENLGISRTESQEIIKKYFARFPGVQSYIEDMTMKAQRDGFVETLYGRRRYIDELKSSNPAVRKFGERAAINAPIQGTASDIVKKAMIVLSEKVPLPIILQVHDELIFEAELEELNKYKKTVTEIMEGSAELKVPLKANSNIGLNWDQAH